MKFVALLVTVALFSPGAIAFAFQNEYEVDESVLDKKTLEFLTITRERGEKDPRIKDFKEQFEKYLSQMLAYQEKDKRYQRVIIVGQLVNVDESLPISSSCKILDYGIFLGCSIMDPVIYKGKETGRFTSGFWFFDRSFSKEKFSKKITVPENTRTVHVGSVSLRPSDPKKFITINGITETEISSIGIRFYGGGRITEVATSSQPIKKPFTWYPVSSDGSFTLGPLPSDYYKIAAKKGDHILAETTGGVTLSNSDELMRIKIDEDLKVVFGEELPEIPFPVAVLVDRGKHIEAVKVLVQEVNRKTSAVIEETAHDLSAKGKVPLKLKAMISYDISLLDMNDKVISSRKMQYHVPKTRRSNMGTLSF